MTKLLLESGADPAARTPAGATILMRAARAGNLRQVRFLLDLGFAIDEVDPRGKTALSHAIHCDHPNEPVIKLLLERGADPDREEGSTTPRLLAMSVRGIPMLGSPDYSALLPPPAGAADPWPMEPPV